MCPSACVAKPQRVGGNYRHVIRVRMLQAFVYLSLGHPDGCVVGACTETAYTIRYIQIYTIRYLQIHRYIFSWVHVRKPAYTLRYIQIYTIRYLQIHRYIFCGCMHGIHTHTHSKPRAYGAYACARAHRPDMHMHTCAHDAHTSVNACILQQICTPTHNTHKHERMKYSRLHTQNNTHKHERMHTHTYTHNIRTSANACTCTPTHTTHKRERMTFASYMTYDVYTTYTHVTIHTHTHTHMCIMLHMYVGVERAYTCVCVCVCLSVCKCA